MPLDKETFLQESIEEDRKNRVLLIEDNPGDALLMQEWVNDVAPERFTMDWESDLASGLSRLTKESFDLVVLDLSLPDSRGWDTFERARKAVPHLPLIVMSGLNDEALAVRTVKKGAQDYIVKGHVDSHSLVRAMSYAIQRRQAERALAEERNLLRSLLDNLPDPIYMKDLSGHYLIDNKAHMKLLGLKGANGIQQKTIFDFLPAETAKKTDRDDRSVMATGNPVFNRVERHLLRDGSKKWFSTTKVPLRNTEGEIFGMVGIDRDITERKEAEEKLASYNRELQEKNEQHMADQRMAREIQQALLPHQYPSFPRKAKPHESAIRFYHTYQPTDLVGGDFYYILPLSDTEAGVFICDVMGHGVRSALVTAIMRTLVEELMPAAHRPSRFLREINRALATILTRTGTLVFATAFYLIVDIGRSQLRYSNAGGHPAPLHIRRSENLVEPLLLGIGRRPGPALGLLEESTYLTVTRTIEEKDILFLFTDGIYEVEGMNGEFYKQERLYQAVKERIDFPPSQLLTELIQEVQTFSSSKEFIDDICLVSVEIMKTGQSVETPEAPDWQI